MSADLLEAARKERAALDAVRATYTARNTQRAQVEESERAKLERTQTIRRYHERIGEVPLDFQDFHGRNYVLAGGLVFQEDTTRISGEKDDQGRRETLTLHSLHVLSAAEGERNWNTGVTNLSVVAHPIEHISDLVMLLKAWPTHSFEVDGVVALLANGTRPRVQG